MAKESKTAITAAMPKKSDGLMSGLKTAPKIKGKGQAKNVETSDEYVAWCFILCILLSLLTIYSEPDSTDLGLQAVTPPKTPHPMVDKIISGRVTKRVSPRKTSIKDYKKIEDPFMELEAVKGDDGENVFGKPDLSEEDDSDPSDEEYGHKMTTVKTEEIL